MSQTQAGGAHYGAIGGSHLLGPGFCLLSCNKVISFYVAGHGTGLNLVPFSALSVHRVQDGGRAIIVNLAGDTAAGIGLCTDVYRAVYLGHGNVVIRRGLWFGRGLLGSLCLTGVS